MNIKVNGIRHTDIILTADSGSEVWVTKDAERFHDGIPLGRTVDLQGRTTRAYRLGSYLLVITKVPTAKLTAAVTEATETV